MKYIDFHTHKNTFFENVISIKNIFLQDINSEFQKVKTQSIDFLLKNFKTSKLISVGLHPWHANLLTLNEVYQKFGLIENQILAIGEIGLDKKCGVDFELQKTVFKTQIEIANQLNKPVVIHCVGAYNDILQISKSGIKKTDWIVHGFYGSKELYNQLIDAKIKVSLGKALFFKNSKILRYIDEIKIENIFLETDESNFRIEEIYSRFAFLKKNKESKLREIIYMNFEKLTNLLKV